MKRFSALIILGFLVSSARGGEKAWQDVFAKGLDAFKTPYGAWTEVASVSLDEKNPKLFQAKEGKGVFYNGAKGRTTNIYTKDKYGDLEVHFEFMIPKGSNSGVKFHGHYEIQIIDSFGTTKKLTGNDCGGVYPRAESQPTYKYLDDGIPPKVNACKPPGEWQTFDIVFLAPRFGKDGQKIANARLPKVLFNGVLIHDNVELLTPTGDNWKKAEKAEGPLMIQADHGPVAFRNFKIRAVK
jgi:hypothetical protein